MSDKLVSVIIPNYNSIKFIKETLESVFNQTHKNVEIIVVDDGSNDGSFEYIEGLKWPNLQLVRNSTKGACAARNHGLRIAIGDFIQFLDADDVLDYDKIKVQLELLENEPNKVAVCSTRHFYENIREGEITDTNFLYSTNSPQEFLLNLLGANGDQEMVAQHAWLTPKGIIDKAGYWDETLIKDQDGEFFCRVVMSSKGICYAENVLCYYRKHKQAGSVSSGSSKKHLLSQLQSLNSKIKQLNIAKDTLAYKNALAFQFKFLAINAYPNYKDIYKIAINNVNHYGGSSYEPVLGGKIVECIKSVFGWRTAKLFSHYINNNKIIKTFLK